MINIHHQLMFPKFLDDPAEYARAEELWKNEWHALVRSVGQEHLWQTPWLNTQFSNGTPFLDGNPIFSALCPGRRIGVRVIQVEPEGDNSDEFTTWTDTFASGDQEAIQELVIHCALTQETLKRAVDAMKRWLTEKK
ncbi:MAG: hypothetical protein HYR84_03755 [Planctomycetes bacterium]|nr:hypothetical protein [Planctomycetota bacterium]